MSCFKLPQWVLHRIDQIRRSFLWGKNDSDSSGFSLVNWDLACLPRRLGGLGIANLRIRNTALLLRWWWTLYRNREALWTITITRIRQTATYAGGPKIWSLAGSFFWKDLQKINKIFVWCTEWRIGNGLSISFWFDNWAGAPMKHMG